MKKIIKQYIWVNQDGNNYSIGLTNEGQDEFGSLAFISLPKIGDKIAVGDSIAEIEAEKAVTELVSPLAGTVVSINQEALLDASSLDVKNEDFAWMVVLNDVSEAEFDKLV